MGHGRMPPANGGPESRDLNSRELSAEEIDTLTSLACCIKRKGPGPRSRSADIHNNRRIPAGYTYLSQLVVHDLVFNDTRVRRFDRLSPVRSLPRTPTLDLDCVYGGGPVASPWLYEAPPADPRLGQQPPRYRLRLGRVRVPDSQLSRDSEGNTCPSQDLTDKYDDIPRVSCPISGDGKASKCRLDPLIADPRNDDTIVLSQLVVLFIKFHNQVACRLLEKARQTSAATLELEWSVFHQAQAVVQHCYRNIVIQDLAPRLLDDEVFERYALALRQGTQFPLQSYSSSHPETLAYAMRCGHAMVRSDYEINEHFTSDRREPPDIITLLSLVGQASSKTPVAEDWIIEWPRFFFDPSAIDQNRRDAKGRQVNFSKPLVPQMSESFVASVRTAGDSIADLAYVDHLRGLELNVPNGQVLAELYGIAPLDPRHIRKWLDFSASALPLDSDQLAALSQNTPPVFYLLCEAAAPPTEGACFGELGSTLLAELLFSAIQYEEQDDGERYARECFGPSVPRDMASLLRLVEDHKHCRLCQPKSES